ncbi:S-layer homology domain-containing protein [Candidatus Collinsella stercoripullorum]|uniref:S-layer homology domain-containing protein n=1 Tax=Candidatus Collinsella stercoripullorum TaxID=2838522 RepID=UPI0022E52EBE|nr:S-layer homology domain-containing protein [Candidatus Collinsella stercoripullorum]
MRTIAKTQMIISMMVAATLILIIDSNVAFAASFQSPENGISVRSEYADPTRTVYVSNSGVYHYVSDCSGMKHYTTMTLQQARSQNKRACNNCVTDSNLPLDPNPPVVFSDVSEATPHVDDIHWLASTGISEGWVEDDGTRTFRGMDTVKRQDMAAFLYRIAGSPAFEPSEADLSFFFDVDLSTPHRREVLWLASTGISEGWVEDDGTRTFRGMDTVKRQDMAAFLHRLSNSGLV